MHSLASNKQQDVWHAGGQIATYPTGRFTLPQMPLVSALQPNLSNWEDGISMWCMYMAHLGVREEEGG
jgi:hypothetical protein